MRIAIPTYRRAHLVKEHTLRLLKACHFRRDDITLFVGCDDKADLEYYELMVPSYRLVSVPPGLHKARNAASEYFETGERVLWIDDDMDDVVRGTKLEGQLYSDTGLFKGWCEWMFKELGSQQLSLFGMYPVANHFFMSKTVTTDLRFVCGGLYGWLNNPTRRATIACKEDYERTLLSYDADGGVLRDNSYSFKSRFARPDGGMHGQRTVRAEQDSVDYLVGRWPQYVQQKSNSKTRGTPEVRLLKGARRHAATG